MDLQSHHASIAHLYTHEGGNLRRHLVRKLGDYHEAEDVLQEACVRMLAGTADSSSLRSPKAFLFTVASNLAVDQLRRAVRQRRLFAEPAGTDDHWDQEDGFQPDPEDGIDARARLERVIAALDDLPPKCRSAFLMHKVHELSYAEVAQRMGVTVSMVEKYLSRALKHVRENETLA